MARPHDGYDGRYRSDDFKYVTDDALARLLNERMHHQHAGMNLGDLESDGKNWTGADGANGCTKNGILNGCNG